MLSRNHPEHIRSILASLLGLDARFLPREMRLDDIRSNILQYLLSVIDHAM